MVLQLLAVAVSQSGETAHSHSHSRVRPFDIAGADVIYVRAPGDCENLTVHAGSGAAAPLGLP